MGWLWDPQLKKFHYFDRVEIIDNEYVTDEVSGGIYQKHAVWRAIGSDATLEVENTNISFLPHDIWFVPWLKSAYGPNVSKGRLIRRDGSAVDLGTGNGFMEYYTAIIPDYVFWGPLMLDLMVLTWSGYAAAIRSAEGRSLVPPAAWCATGLFGVWALNLAWSGW